MAILDQETINWISVEDRLPGEDVTVLVAAPGSEFPVWLGYYDGNFWFAVTGEGYGDDEEIAEDVTAWAELPRGPA